MSENEAFEVGQGELESDSVFDFLYHDARRVGSFLAQFDDAGHLQQVKQTDSVGKVSGNKVSFSGAKGVPLVAHGSGAYERTWGGDGREGLERVYDPLWTNARTLLDFLTERDMIERDLSRARIGQFVLVSGSLSIIDLTVLEGMWEIAAIKKAITDGVVADANPAEATSTALNRHERRAAARKGVTAAPVVSEQEEYVEGMLQLLKLLPHTVQARLSNADGGMVWSTLKEDNLVVASSDLLLKHGLTVSGEWSMLGILDATPEGSSDPSEAMLMHLQALASFADSPFAQALVHLIPVVRQLGRPQHAFGMTPLLIFRDVSA